jgi:hypothetical protein
MLRLGLTLRLWCFRDIFGPVIGFFVCHFPVGNLHDGRVDDVLINTRSRNARAELICGQWLQK